MSVIDCIQEKRMCCELLFRPLLRLENAQMKVVKKSEHSFAVRG
jgi:hypothetical protein